MLLIPTSFANIDAEKYEYYYYEDDYYPPPEEKSIFVL